MLVPAYHHGVEVGALAAAGAIPRFVRVDARMRLDLADAERKIGPRTRALYVIHYAGFAQPMDEVNALARRRGLLVIEDCALSLLAAEGSRPLGSTGHLGIFCFYKTLPVPNGGALVVNDPAVRGAPAVPLRAPLASTLSHAAGSLLANLALRFGDAGEAIRSAVRRAYALARGASGLSPVSTGTMSFDPAWKDLGMSPLSALVARRLDPGRDRRGAAAELLPAPRDGSAIAYRRCSERSPPARARSSTRCSARTRRRSRRSSSRAGSRRWTSGARGTPLCPLDAFPEVASLRRRVLELPVHQDLAPEDMAYVARAVKEAL